MGEVGLGRLPPRLLEPSGKLLLESGASDLRNIPGEHHRHHVAIGPHGGGQLKAGRCKQRLDFRDNIFLPVLVVCAVGRQLEDDRRFFSFQRKSCRAQAVDVARPRFPRFPL